MDEVMATTNFVSAYMDSLKVEINDSISENVKFFIVF